MPRLIQAVDLINDENKHKVQLEIVGGGREYSKDLLRTIEENNNILFHGKINDKKVLADTLRSCDILLCLPTVKLLDWFI